jgi:protein-S-isoprenylcysteine O-methyltransferase Ste14
MTIAGAAPKIAVPTFVYLVITIIIDQLKYPIFKISLYHSFALLIIGIILIIMGIMVVINIARKLKKSFASGSLMTDGLYAYFRNPMYAAYLLLIIPGIAFLFNSWLALTTIILNFILLQIFIREEYNYLNERFGEEYKTYLNKVWIKFL